MAIDVGGNAYLTGITDDHNFQLTPGTIGPTPIGYPIDTAFVLKVDMTGKLVYSTLIPGNAPYTLGRSTTTISQRVASRLTQAVR